MSEIIKPTCQEIRDEIGFEQVHREADDSWRHGSYVTEVYRRESDQTYWRVAYRRSTDGETNELREGLAGIEQCEPKQVTTTEYVLIRK